jgi:hypothetical protein
MVHHLVIISIAPASDEKDRSCATDVELHLTGGTVAVRVRRPDCNYRDLTLRAHRDNGMKTELAKIKEGHASRYFYGWTDYKRAIVEWILVDLDKVRETGLLEKPRPHKLNKDGTTYFIGISIRELFDAGCLIAYQLKNKKWERAA